MKKISISKYLEKYNSRVDNSMYDWKYIFEDLPANKTYTIAVDVRDGKLIFGPCDRVRASVYNIVCKVKITHKDDNRSLREKAREVRSEIKDYTFEHSITYTDACRKYGAKNVTEMAFLYETKNPHYKHGSMYIYDADVIEYWISKNGKNNKKKAS